MEVTEIWIRFFFILRTLFSFFLCWGDNALGSFLFKWTLCWVLLPLSPLIFFFVNGLVFTQNISLLFRCADWRFKMLLLPAEQIGSGRWFNDCFWHPAIPLLSLNLKYPIVRTRIVVWVCLYFYLHTLFSLSLSLSHSLRLLFASLFLLFFVFRVVPHTLANSSHINSVLFGYIFNVLIQWDANARTSHIHLEYYRRTNNNSHKVVVIIIIEQNGYMVWELCGGIVASYYYNKTAT